eukprot:1161967-Pelagomonas_calceolata.AAC.1
MAHQDSGGGPKQTSPHPTALLERTWGVTKVFVFYLEDNIFTSTTCKSAIEYSTDVLHELKTGYNITKVIKYTSADAAADPRFYAGLVDQAMSIGADAILGCDFKVGHALVAQRLPLNTISLPAKAIA